LEKMPPDDEPPSPDSGPPALSDGPEAAYTRALHAELTRRIGEIGNTPEQAFGPLGRADAVLMIALFILLPALAVWIYR
jgi:hypothetical protein